MSLLSTVLTNIGTWLLEKFGAMLSVLIKKKTKESEIEKAANSDAAIQRKIIDRLDELDSMILFHKNNNTPIPQSIFEEIERLENELKEVSRKINSHLLD
mgnify:FL=1